MTYLYVLLPFLLSYAFLSSALPLSAAQGSWDDVSALLNNAIQNHTFPGCVAIVASAKGTLFAKAFGTLTYDQASPQVSKRCTAFATFPRFPPDSGQVNLDTKFDIASLSKVTACTTAAMQVRTHEHPPNTLFACPIHEKNNQIKRLFCSCALLKRAASFISVVGLTSTCPWLTPIFWVQNSLKMESPLSHPATFCSTTPDFPQTLSLAMAPQTSAAPPPILRFTRLLSLPAEILYYRQFSSRRSRTLWAPSSCTVTSA